MMKGNSIVWMYCAVATLLCFGSTSGIGNSFTLEGAGGSSQRVPSLIRSVVPNFDDDETTSRIWGLNGLCVDVRGGRFVNANPIQLSTCDPEKDENQLWTFKKDGTIRSQSHNTMCLTACEELPRSYVMIFECSEVVPDAAYWEVWNNGTIMNPGFGQALTATSGELYSPLVIDVHVYSLAQCWIPTDNTVPYVASIVGLNGFCLTHSEIVNTTFCDKRNANVWIEKCGGGKQNWSFYPDGSIRPVQNENTCLSGDASLKDGIVRILDCYSTCTGQRWYWRDVLAIWNLHYELVLEVKDSDPSLKEIVIRNFTGNLNQMWIPIFP